MTTELALTAPPSVVVRVWDKDWNLVGRIEEGDLVEPDFDHAEQASFTLRVDHPITQWLMKSDGDDAHLSVDRAGRDRWCGELDQWDWNGRHLRIRWRDALYGLRQLLDWRDPL